jgi:hypothetical protein
MVRFSGARRRVPTWKRGDNSDDGLSPSPPPPEQRCGVGSAGPRPHSAPRGPVASGLATAPARAGSAKPGLAVTTGNLRGSISALRRANRVALDRVDRALREEPLCHTVECPLWSASPRGAEGIETKAASRAHVDAKDVDCVVECDAIVGVGLFVAKDPSTGACRVSRIATGSAAHLAQIRVGDEIIRLGNSPTTPGDTQSVEQVQTQLAGALGSHIQIALRRTLPSGGFFVYNTTLVRSNLDIQRTVKTLQFQITDASPIALRLLMADGRQAIFQMRKLIRQLATGPQEGAFASWKFCTRLKQQVKGGRIVALITSKARATAVHALKWCMYQNRWIVCLLRFHAGTGVRGEDDAAHGELQSISNQVFASMGHSSVQKRHHEAKMCPIHNLAAE